MCGRISSHIYECTHLAQPSPARPGQAQPSPAQPGFPNVEIISLWLEAKNQENPFPADMLKRCHILTRTHSRNDL